MLKKESPTVSNRVLLVSLVEEIQQVVLGWKS
jgi:hypothetical protein